MSIPDRTPRAADPQPVRVRAVEALGDDWFTLRTSHLDVLDRTGEVRSIARLSMHRCDRAAVLLYSRSRGAVVLTGQFRLPVLPRGRPDSRLAQMPGVLADGQDALESVRREAAEETGFPIGARSPAFVVHPAPQPSCERTRLFTAPYTPRDRVGPGGGLAEECKDVRVLELPLELAVERVLGEEAAGRRTLLPPPHAKNQRLCA